MDIDMLGITSNQQQLIVNQIVEILAVDVINDGLIFDPLSIQTSKILEDADYEGVKIMFYGKLETAKIKIQIDIGFGDVVHPHPEKANFPSLLDFPAPNLLCYSKESVIAEKFDAMVSRGMANSRMKDFYDVWLLCRQFSFESSKLVEAVRLTFDQRKTEIPKEIEAFSKAFVDAKPAQWAAFRKKLELEYVPVSFQEIVSVVESFLQPIASAIVSGAALRSKWDAPGPWVIGPQKEQEIKVTEDIQSEYEMS